MKNLNFTKKEISKEINSKLGLPVSLCDNVVDSMIKILIENIKLKDLNIKNFGTFKILNKKERIGRNPKTKVSFKISARKSLSFSTANKLNNFINDIR